MMEMTLHQQDIFDKLVSDIDKGIKGNNDNKILVLSGSAGVGKSFLTARIIESLYNKRIHVSTPTHKSLRVLENMLKDNDINETAKTSTIHSFLKLKLQPNYNTGFQELLAEYDRNKEKQRNIDVLFVDEGSMICSVLMDHIFERVQNGSVKVVVFVLDPFQLPPVTEGLIHEELAKGGKYRLQQIVRQAAESPIIRLADDIRKCIEFKDYKSILGLFKKHKHEDIIIHNSLKSFVGTYFKDNSNDKLVGSFTNKTVKFFNGGIRNKLIKSTDYLTVGEQLIFNEAYSEFNEMIYRNGDIITIDSCEKDYDEENELVFWNVISEETQQSFRTIDSDYIDRYEELLLSKSNKAKKADGYNRKLKWKEYWRLKSKYANVSYTYALTNHKSQGTTVENSYLNVRELIKHLEFQDFDLIYRLLYVGVTRPKNKLHVLI